MRVNTVAAKAVLQTVCTEGAIRVTVGTQVVDAD